MVAAVRYRVALDCPVLTWQGAIFLIGAIERSRSLIVTVRGYRPDGAEVAQTGRRWFFSDQFDANFYYVPVSEAGQLLVLPRLTHYEAVTRIELVVRPFATDFPGSVADTVSTLCFQDRDPIGGLGRFVISAHVPEVVDV